MGLRERVDALEAELNGVRTRLQEVERRLTGEEARNTDIEAAARAAMRRQDEADLRQRRETG